MCSSEFTYLLNTILQLKDPWLFGDLVISRSGVGKIQDEPRCIVPAVKEVLKKIGT